jgi:hypothetical protein
MALRFALLMIGCVLIASGATCGARPDPMFAKEEELERKLDRIIIPRAEFRETPVQEALDFAFAEAQRLDPQFHTIKIVMNLHAPTGTVSVALTKEPFLSVLNLITGSANLKYRIEADGIHIVPKDDPDPLFTRDIRIPDDLYPVRSEEDRGNRAEMFAQFKRDPREFLINEGATFQQGAEAILTDDASQLKVRNSRIELRWIKALLQPPPKDDLFERGRALARTSEMRKRLAGIILPKVEFNKTPLDEVVRTLEKLCVRHDPKTTKADRVSIKMVKHKPPYDLETPPIAPPAPSPSYVPGLEPEPQPESPKRPVPKPRTITFTASQIPLSEALQEIAQRAGFLVDLGPNGATLIPIETVDEVYAVLAIAPGSLAKLEPQLIKFRLGKPVTKTWLGFGGSNEPGPPVIYNQRLRHLHIGGIDVSPIIDAVQDAWVDYFSAEAANRRKAR